MQASNLPTPSVRPPDAAALPHRGLSLWRRGIAILGTAAVAAGVLVVAPTTASASVGTPGISSFSVTSNPGPAAAGFSYAYFSFKIDSFGTESWETVKGVASFLCDGSVLGTKAVSFTGSRATVSSSFPVSGGDHQCKATFDSYSGRTESPVVPFKSVVTPLLNLNHTPNTVASGEEMTFTANVTDGYSPTGTVTFKEGGSVLGASTIDASGAASWTAKCLNPGSHSISATYSGDAFNRPVTKTPPAVTVTGSKKCTQTQVTSSANPSVLGTKITLQATVTGSGTKAPVGPVVFKDGAVHLGIGVLSAGKASLNLYLPRGDHQITAVYAGDPENLGSTSAPYTQHVN